MPLPKTLPGAAALCASSPCRSLSASAAARPTRRCCDSSDAHVTQRPDRGPSSLMKCTASRLRQFAPLQRGCGTHSIPPRSPKSACPIATIRPFPNASPAFTPFSFCTWSIGTEDGRGPRRGLDCKCKELPPPPPVSGAAICPSGDTVSERRHALNAGSNDAIGKGGAQVEKNERYCVEPPGGVLPVALVGFFIRYFTGLYVRSTSLLLVRRRRCKWPTRGPILRLGSASGKAVMVRLVKSPRDKLDGEDCKAKV